MRLKCLQYEDHKDGPEENLVTWFQSLYPSPDTTLRLGDIKPKPVAWDETLNLW